MADGLDLNKWYRDFSELQEKAKLVDQLKEENERLQQKLRPVPDGWAQLLEDNHRKQATIDALERQLKMAQTKIQTWRQKYTLSSSPVGSDGIMSELVIDSHRSSGGNPLINERSSPANGRVIDETNQAKEKHKILRNKRPLAETSGNSGKQPAPRKRRAGSHGAHAVPLLAEDGEDYTSVKHEHTKPENHIFKSAVHHRVVNLLSGPSPALPLLRGTAPPPNTSTTLQMNRPPKFLPPKKPKSLPNTPRRPPTFLPSKSRVSAGVEDSEPFRSRPIHRLALSHFKLNSDHNGGVGYAFSDVIRDRHRRKCLPGCTRSCCGSIFKALAASSDLQIADDELLRNFWGHKSEKEISELTSVARANLLAEARMKLVADKYGKHRNAHDRAPSPVGFWRTEMPGTQEELQDREHAKLKERQEVERRYHEACRVDGKWKFGDE